MTGLVNRFVGRKAELEALTALFASAKEGRGDVMLVMGEAGMGKSRLVEHAVDQVRDTHTVLFGRSFEAGAAPAYLPWAQLLRRLFRSAGEDVLDAHRASRLVSLVPELRLRFPEMPRFGVHGEEARFALFDAIAEVFLSVAQDEPLVLVFEDVHVADPGSLLLLEDFVDECRSAPIAVVATARPGEVDASVGAERLKAFGQKAHSLPLSGLTRGDVRTYLAEALDASVPDAVVDAVMQATEGHPLFVTEVAQLLMAHGALRLVEADEAVAVPKSVRDAITSRLELLSPPTRALLRRAALIGRDFDVDRLVAMVGAERRELMPQIHEARGAAVIAEVVPGTDRFAHVLIRDVLAEELTADEEAGLRLSLVAALEAKDDPPWEEIAHQLARVSSDVDPLRRVRVNRRAAEQANDRLGFDDVVSFREAALAAIPADDEEERRRETLALADALLHAGRIQEGQRRCVEVAEKARAAGDGVGFAEAALVCGSVFRIADVDDTLVKLLTDALSLLPPEAVALRARCLARLAAALQPCPDPSGPIDMAREAIRMARQADDPHTLFATMRGAISAMMDLGDPRERSGLNEEYVALAERFDDRLEAFRGLRRLTYDHVQLGGPAEIRRAVDTCSRIADETGHPTVTWAAAALRAMVHMREGDFQRAVEENAHARSLVERAHDPSAERSLALQRFLLARLLGFPDGERTPMDALRRLLPDIYFGRELLSIVEGVLRGTTGDAAGGREAIPDDAIATALTMDDSSILDCLAEIAFTARDPELGREVYDQTVCEDPITFASWGTFGMASGPPRAHLAGLGAAACERWDDAFAAFERAYRTASETNARPHAVWAMLRHAETLVRRGGPGDRERARAKSEEAARLAAALGMEFVRDRALALVDAAPSREGETAAALPEATFTLTRDGEGYRIEHGGRSFLLKDTKGVRLLEKLVAEPGREHHVLDLSSPTGRRVVTASSDAGEVIDAQARAAYRKRLLDLRAELEEAEADEDLGRRDRVRGEIRAIEAELKSALGLGGKSRKAASDAERARVNVQRRIKDAIKRVEAQDEDLARHLDWAIRTGTLCSYRPW